MKSWLRRGILDQSRYQKGTKGRRQIDTRGPHGSEGRYIGRQNLPLDANQTFMMLVYEGCDVILEGYE